MEPSTTFIGKVRELSPVIALVGAIGIAVTVVLTANANLANRLDAINARLDVIQAENNRRHDDVNHRFDTLQAENNRRYDDVNRRFDALQAENNRRFEAMQAENNRRFDAEQAADDRRFDEINRRFDELLEVLRDFERRISRLEGRTDGE